MSLPIGGQAAQKFKVELASLLDRMVDVETIKGEKYTGRIVGYDPETLTLCLTGVSMPDQSSYSRVFIKGDAIYAIFRKEEPFDLSGLAVRLEKVFPGMIRLHDAAGVITVMDKIRVTETGIAEGSGPAADRVRKVYEQFLEEKRAEAAKVTA